MTNNRHRLPRLVQGLLWGWLTLAVCRGAIPGAPVPLEREASWRIVDFSKDAGILRRRVFDIAFQTNSTVWLAVSDGLYCYDGYHWRRFSITDGLPSSFIRAVSVTRDGTVWVGTDKGAGVWNGTTFERRGTEGGLAGPNVRRIVEGRDGSLWFCCDRWSEAMSQGGLTRLKGGEWRTYGPADGLPSDYVLNFFEQSNGARIAMTVRGAAVLEGDRWTALRNIEEEAGNEYYRAMAETADGARFAEGMESMLVQRDGRWARYAGKTGDRSPPFCAAGDGALVAALMQGPNTVSFARWNGKELVRASAEITRQGFDVQCVSAAPDGSIWAVGRGTILRWEYLPGAWEWYPDLPPPVFEDRRGRLWFGDTERVAVMDRGQVTRVPEMRIPLVEDGRGGVWSAGGTGVVRWVDGRIEPAPAEVRGIRVLWRGVADPSGAVWLYGSGRDGACVLAGETARGWRVYNANDLGNREVSALTPDSRDGVWAALVDSKAATYEVVRLSAEGMRNVPIDGARPAIRRPDLCASKDRLYLYGYHGLWESMLGERLVFSRVQEDGGVYAQGTSIGDTTAFVSQEGLDGNAVILLKRPDGWRRQRVSLGQDLQLSRDGWLMVADGAEFVLWQTREQSSATYVSLPTDATITAMLRASDGEYWLGTSQGLLHLRPRPTLPDTVVEGPDSLVEGASAVVWARGVARFAPRSLASRYSFSWRLDSEPWSAYQEWPANGLPLRGVPAGKHLLQVRARDGLGHEDPVPAALPFEVRPIPIQDRRWFRPVLAGIGVLLAGLSLALLSASRRLRRYAGNLEEQVQARTAELREDIARRQLAEAERERLMLAIEQAAEIILITDAQGTILYANSTFEKITGYSRAETLGKNPRLLKSGRHDAAFYREFWATLRRGETWKGRLINRKKDGSLYTEEATVSPVRDASGRTVNYVATKRDVTEELALQEQLAQVQKMESVGRLAGGVAHDFNNMLQAILGNTALAMEQQALTPQLREHLEEVLKAAERSADLTRQLLAFARKQTIRPRVLNLNDTVGGMLKMLERLIGENIEIAWLPGRDLWLVEMDPGQVDQILANLCVNARDAIRGAGKVIIQTANATLDSTYATSHPDSATGDYVVLTVSDNGQGMDTHTRAHLFEPFFTTKELGRGTGLGLATVFGIVKQNRGLINVYSEPGRGTTFRVYLPRTAAPAAEAEAKAGPLVGGTETILLVEDEALILTLGRRMLEEQGYTVLVASTPRAALELAAQHRGTIHLLITDVVMPGMNGKALFERLAGARPGLKCLFMSGYTADIIAHHGLLEEGVDLLQKPFTMQDITRKAREVLDRPRPQ